MPQVYDDKTNTTYSATVDKPRLEAAIRELLIAIGENPDREGLQGTPDRVARAYEELTSGMREEPSVHLRKQFSEPESDDLIIVRDIPFTSLCEHHLLPFTGHAHIAYLPAGGRITGLSKVARTVSSYAHRLQLQERLTSQIADAFVRELAPQGVLVVLEAEHSCMSIRGIKAAGAITTTSSARGVFATSPDRKKEALTLLGIHA